MPDPPSNVVLNKAAAIERCLERVREVYADDPASLEDFTRQDSIVLNLQRAAQAAIGLAMHLVRARGLGVPQTSREAFRLLADGTDLDPALATAMERMVGFRNVAVHDYRAIHLPVVRAIVERHLGDVAAFARWALVA